MPKKVELEPHLSHSDLKARYRSSYDPVEARRWHLLWKVASGWRVKDAASVVGLNYDYARRVIKKYNEIGIDSVTNKRNRTPRNHKGGKESILNLQQLEKLKEALKKKPRDGGVWTGPKVVQWMEKETGRSKIYDARGWDYLKKLEYSWQSPRPKHKKGCPIEQKEFKENLPKKVKLLQEENSNAEVEVWFFDEHRVGLKPILAKVWAPVRERPSAIVHHRYEWLYVYGFVNPKTGDNHYYLIPRVNVQWLNLVFETFAKEVGAGEEKIILIVEDNAGWHRSNKVCLPLGIKVEPLPPYSPELQPAERLWKLVDEPLVNTYFNSLDDLEKVLVERCRFLQENMQTEIKALTNYHWLTY
ncbi:IS630 family transposase [Microcoleus sp. BR0-C5]|uniref:IS630 family transposase n=1 Tax=Microcoleus sp. BR0-C5 TaxID=2818713 RepID=UPI002FD0982E